MNITSSFSIRNSPGVVGVRQERKRLGLEFLSAPRAVLERDRRGVAIRIALERRHLRARRIRAAVPLASPECSVSPPSPPRIASQFLLPSGCRCLTIPATQGGRSRPPSEGPTTPLSVSCQPAPVLTAVKAHRYALPPLRGADGLDGGSAQARASSGRQGLKMTSTSGSSLLPADDHRYDPLEAAG